MYQTVYRDCGKTWNNKNTTNHLLSSLKLRMTLDRLCFELRCGLFKRGHFVPGSCEKQSHNSIQHSADSVLVATSNWPVSAVVKCSS